MKMHIKLFNSALVFGLLSLPVISFAGTGDDIDKKKTINRSYTVTTSDKLEIENSFGDVVVNTWDKNEIKVDIEIGAKASSDQKAQEILDQIAVKDSRSGNTISFKTDVDINDHKGRNKHDDGDGDRKFYIDYTIYMPASNPLNIENSFGKTKVPDFKGPVSLTSKFGSLNTGNLANVEDIDVEFGKAELGSIHNGEITLKFNSKSTIEKVSGSIKVKSEFSGDVRFTVDNNIDELSVYESYSNVSMVVTKDLSANFDIHTSFGNFHNGTDFRISEAKDDDDQYGPHFDKDYSGQAGSGKAKIKIKSSFGKVKISYGNDKSSNNDNDEDDDKNEKQKSKKPKTSI